MFEVVVEVLPNINMCNMFISLSNEELLYKTASVKKSECTFYFKCGTELCLKLPKGVCLIPDAFTSVNQEGNILIARLQMNEHTSKISALSGDILNNIMTYENTPETHLVDTILRAQCKQCKGNVIEKVKFRRVLPLPSVDWDQASEGWFCHLHKTDRQKLKPQSLQPANDECFFTELFLLLHGDLVKNFIEDEQSGNIYCSRCKLLLGAKGKQSSLKLWTHGIVWIGDCGSVLYKKDLPEIILSLFHNLDKDSFGVNCRLVLQTQTIPRQHLFMVTMNTNQKLLVSKNICYLKNLINDNKSGYSEVKSTGTGNNEPKVEGHEVALHPVPEKKCARETKINLVSFYSVMLMYDFKEGEDELTGSWVDDTNVHIIPCSVPILQEIRTLLQRSNDYLPDCMKIVDNLRVGFFLKNKSLL